MRFRDFRYIKIYDDHFGLPKILIIDYVNHKKIKKTVGTKINLGVRYFKFVAAFNKNPSNVKQLIHNQINLNLIVRIYRY